MAHPDGGPPTPALIPPLGDGLTAFAAPEPDALGTPELSAWLRLLASPGIGREAARRLLAAFGSPEAVFNAPEAGWRSVVGPQAAAGLRAPPPEHAQRLAAVLAWRAAGQARRVMVLGQPDYPEALLNTADPPLLLYLVGRASLLSAPSVAVVGSRRPTPQGRDNARAFATGLAAQGWTIVSGLALGVDGAAHEGALLAGDAGAGTVAVVGTGVDRVYPRSHLDLARRLVAQGGLLVSELPLGTPPLAAHFPQRNRIIAGLSRGTLVVEAALRSGSLITARLAAEAGREVMVLPGSILADQAAGCHELIRQGATLVVSVEQVLAELGPRPRAAHNPTPSSKQTPDQTPDQAPDQASEQASEQALPPTPARATRPRPAVASRPPSPGVAPEAPAEAADPVLDALGHDPASLDALIARCGWPAPALSAHLLGLELAGLVARLPGGLYQRLARG